MNSPETPLYQKSKVLFGIDKAKQAIRKAEGTVLVEGQMDLVLSHQAGVTNAVAVSGTALTEEHLVALRRLSENLVMAFDADKAGIAAAGRALAMALSLGMDVKVALLPTGLDPADVVRANPTEWIRLIKEANHVIDFYLAVYRSLNLSGSELRKKVEAELIPYVAALASSLDQGHFVKKVSEAVGVQEQAVWESVRKIRPQWKSSSVSPQATPSYAPHVRSLAAYEKLLGILEWASKTPGVFDTTTLMQELNRIAGTQLAEWNETLAVKKDQLALEAEIAYSESRSAAADSLKLLHSLEEEWLSEQFAAIMNQLRDAEAKGDKELIKALLATCQSITSQITTLKKKRYSQG